MFSRGALTSLLSVPAPPSVISLRGYIANFWDKPTAWRFPGKKGTKQSHFKYNDNRLKIRQHDVRLSEIKRIRASGFRYRMSYPNGRVFLMNRILNNEKFICEF